MSRKQEVLKNVDRLIEEGEKPTVEKLSALTGFTAEDVHRLLNKLEIEGKVRSNSKTFDGRKIRFIQRIRQ